MDPIAILSGFVVGAIVGMTGVGGGSLVTPLLIFSGIPPAVAVVPVHSQGGAADLSQAVAHVALDWYYLLVFPLLYLF